MSDGEIFNMDRLHTSRQFQKILNVEIPHITLPVLLGSNLAVLVEGAVRNHLLTMKGYSATERFIARQKTIIDQGGT
jgi:HPr kinase/phosphorylase